MCYIIQFAVTHGNNTVHYNLIMMPFQKKTEGFTHVRNQPQFVEQLEYALAVTTAREPLVTDEQICCNEEE